MSVAPFLGWSLALLSAAGVTYQIGALAALARFRRRAAPPAAPAEPVSLLKPLHGAEPRLAANLATFLDQDWPAPVEIVAGVQSSQDPAGDVVAHLPRRPDRTGRLVVDATRHGANAKVANLINMAPAAVHDLIVLSDSDMSVPRDYLAKIAAALAGPNVGAVTCLYRGRGDAGFWSVLGAASVSYQFLPGVLVSLALGRGAPCMGSTIALRRETLAAIGGFAAFADILADDHAIGAAIRARGLDVAVPDLLAVHASAERSFTELVRHELRWAATVRQVTPPGDYAGLIVTHPLPLALLAGLFHPLPGFALLAAAFLARAALRRRIDRWAGASSAPLWALPARDILSFGVFVASFGARSVDWRGQRLRISGAGRIVRPTELS